ncbi:MAG: DUF2760 domain-containing protein [Byssovorax sp.]
MTETLRPLPFAGRFFLAWSLIFRVLFDGLLAARVARAADGPAELPPAPPPEPAPVASKPVAPVVSKPATPTPEPALQLLALFQREGRFIDFVEQDLGTFSDAEIGAVARVVHDGCQRALHGHAKVAPIRAEDEGASVTIAEGYSPAEIKLSGNVGGSAPYRGKVQHRGWRATDLVLPTPVTGHDASVLAPAEIEL